MSVTDYQGWTMVRRKRHGHKMPCEEIPPPLLLKQTPLLLKQKQPQQRILCFSCQITRAYTHAENRQTVFRSVSNTNSNRFLTAIAKKFNAIMTSHNRVKQFDFDVDESPYRVKIDAVENNNEIFLTQYFLHNDDGCLREFARRHVIIRLRP